MSSTRVKSHGPSKNCPRCNGKTGPHTEFCRERFNKLLQPQPDQEKPAPTTSQTIVGGSGGQAASIENVRKGRYVNKQEQTARQSQYVRQRDEVVQAGGEKRLRRGESSARAEADDNDVEMEPKEGEGDQQGAKVDPMEVHEDDMIYLVEKLARDHGSAMALVEDMQELGEVQDILDLEQVYEDEDEKQGILDRIEAEKKKGKVGIQRFKGLGEMNPLQLRETTMALDTRRLVQLTIESFTETNKLMDMMLAKKRAADRKSWLEKKGDLAEI